MGFKFELTSVKVREIRLFFSKETRVSDNSSAYKERKKRTIKKQNKTKKRIYVEYSDCEFDNGGKESHITRMSFIL